MNFPDSPHLHQLQRDLWQWSNSKSVVIIGAGFSLNANPEPGVRKYFPTWKQLARLLFDELHPIRSDAATEMLAEHERRFYSTSAPRIASEYEANFGRQKLENAIRVNIPDSKYHPCVLHELLLQLPWTDVFTTNYDTLFEMTELSERSYYPIIKATELSTAFLPRIIKLHGSLPSHTPFIITEEDYCTYHKHFAPFVNTVQQSLLENTFVLLGFSGDDPNFLAWTGWIRDELGLQHAPIYLVGSLSLNNAEKSLLHNHGVTPIDLSTIFHGEYTEQNVHRAGIEWFLRQLHLSRPQRPSFWHYRKNDLQKKTIETFHYQICILSTLTKVLNHLNKFRISHLMIQLLREYLRAGASREKIIPVG
ncbi:MAG: SIR2 family protein [Candidatus Hatepunaea meridiana]|nr:SIR2 family protein [Candidatus Hatepunaea meridiana]